MAASDTMLIQKLIPERRLKRELVQHENIRLDMMVVWTSKDNPQVVRTMTLWYQFFILKTDGARNISCKLLRRYKTEPERICVL